MSHRTRSAAAWQEPNGRYTRLPDSLLDVLSAREHQVIHLLLSHRWTDASLIYPSVRTMARRLRCSDRTIQRTVRSLERRGYLVVEYQYRADKGQQSSIYHPGPMLLPLLPPAGGEHVTDRRGHVAPPVTRAAGKREPWKRYTPTRGHQGLAYSQNNPSAYLETREGPLRRR